MENVDMLPIQWKVVSPLHGDMLLAGDEAVNLDTQSLCVRVQGPSGSAVYVNDVRANEHNGCYEAEVPLKEGRIALAVEADGGSLREKLDVYWLPRAAGHYRISVDDCIWFLQDLAEKRDVYRSLFDNPFLAMFKKLHDVYGTKVHFNLYERTEGFTLTDMPDTYKAEWQVNSDWMRLSFHAKQNDPPKPYEHASADELMADCERVTREIRRFAGEELLSSVTTIHYGAATREGCRALREFGFQALVGYFRLHEGRPFVSYYLDELQTTHLKGRDCWKDHSEDLIFVKVDGVLDKLEPSQIGPHLDQVKARAGEAGLIELLIHEQYFYPFYSAYQSDYLERLTTAVQWARDNGYKPALWSEHLTV